MKRGLVILAILVSVLGLIGWGGSRVYQSALAPKAEITPTARVRRGEVRFLVSARGELQGGNSQMLTAPMMGGGELIITQLRQPGDMVKKDEIVVQFDTTEQSYKLREAEADLAEAEQQLEQAKAEKDAKEEEDRYLLIKARADLRLAEIEARKNPMLAAMVARQNEIAIEAARANLDALEKDLADRKASAEAGIQIQEAARNKAQVLAANARHNIDAMSLKANADGYVSVQQNMSGDIFFMGMQFPLYQVGDIARPGMGVAQIPDLENWEIVARIGELDRGHIAEKQEAEVRVVALAGRGFRARIKNIGGTFGPPWNRRFECKLSLESPTPDLRPGMTSHLVVNTGEMKGVLWVPAQALQESDGRTFVYARNGAGFSPTDVKLVRRSESQVVITGLAEGAEVALATPGQKQNSQPKGGPPKAGPAIPKKS
ncbi:MAG: efflux RND transporter periplasmic adaptor subunit [Bryobacteraceae bacterium]